MSSRKALADSGNTSPVDGLVGAGNAQHTGAAAEDVPLLPLAFCAPPNQKLTTDYWDRVADRLFKVRNCLNIEGVYRELDLFEPPIDPGLLARAKASGLDLGAVLREASASIPTYRFRYLYQRALELAGDVVALGAALLGAIERRDAEELQLIRAGHQRRLQAAMLRVLEDRVAEAREAIEGLRKTREATEYRRAYYRSRTYRIREEKKQEESLSEAQNWTQVGEGISLAVAILGVLPNISSGFAGWVGPVLTVATGREQALAATDAVSTMVRMRTSYLNHVATLAGISAGHVRRKEDWDFQADLAERELESLDKQIVAAEIRLAIAEKEVENHKLQMEQQAAEEEFLRSKFSNSQLYGWMMNQLSALYFQSYQLAYDMAKRAEKAWQFELGIPERRFISFDHWDGLKKGLLAGEKLRFELRQMEAAFIENRKREYQLSRAVSLRELDARLLNELKTTGQCEFSLHESLFDLDAPGHYMRRLKSVSLTVPAVAGPYAPVRCTLRLLKSYVRVAPALGPKEAQLDDDPFVRKDNLGIRSIVTSRGENDRGLFNEPEEERYSPFEGAGAISTWRIELPEIPAFDYSTISDVILHLEFTALEGGEAFRQEVVARVGERMADNGFLHGFDVRSLAPEEARRFLSPDGSGEQTIVVPVREELLPYPLRAYSPKIEGITLALYRRGTQGESEEPLPLQVVEEAVNLDMMSRSGGSILHGFVSKSMPIGPVTIEVDAARLPDSHPFVEVRGGRKCLVADEMVVVIHGKGTVPGGNL